MDNSKVLPLSTRTMSILRKKSFEKTIQRNSNDTEGIWHNSPVSCLLSPPQIQTKTKPTGQGIYLVNYCIVSIQQHLLNLVFCHQIDQMYKIE